ncbi:MAG: tyrosine-type recombinase/integrase [Methylocella sp.]
MLKSLPIGEWPKSDQEAWDTACHPAVRLRRGGSASRLAPITRDDIQRRYGYFLTFLKEIHRFDAAASCASLITPEHIGPFVDRMRDEWSATTLFMTIHKLKQIAGHLAPSSNFKWLSNVADDLKAEDGPVKRPPVVDASELLTAGLTLVEEYSPCDQPMDLATARNIRNGLMIALLASCPIRVKNLGGLTLGRSFHFSDSCWWIDLPGSETKSGRPDMRMLPGFFTAALERYLLEARPFLLACRNVQERHPPVSMRDSNLAANSAPEAAPQNKTTASSDRNGGPAHDDGLKLVNLSGPLWISRYGDPMSYSSIHHALTSTTEAAIGVAISPHGFRYAAATTAAWKAGNMPHLAPALLQHRDRRMTEAAYIRATSFEAAQQLGKILRQE